MKLILKQPTIVPAQPGFYWLAIVDGDAADDPYLEVHAVLAWRVELRGGSGNDDGNFTLVEKVIAANISNAGAVESPDGTVDDENEIFPSREAFLADVKRLHALLGARA